MIKAILFDVDGVLVDSLKANTVFYQYVMEKNGYRKPTAAEYLKVFNLPFDDTMAALSKEKDKRKLRAVMANAVEERRDKYPLWMIKAPAGAQSTIKLLSKHYKLGIATSRTRTAAEQVISQVYKINCFSVVITRQDYRRRKPSPDLLVAAAKRLRLRHSEIVYVGDMATDAEAARAAGMHFVLFNSKRIPGVKCLAKKFSEIPRIVKRLDEGLC
jgi:HAD superfamily hydrolase (TIGR01549 family)